MSRNRPAARGLCSPRRVWRSRSADDMTTAGRDSLRLRPTVAVTAISRGIQHRSACFAFDTQPTPAYSEQRRMIRPIGPAHGPALVALSVSSAGCSLLTTPTPSQRCWTSTMPTNVTQVHSIMAYEDSGTLRAGATCAPTSLVRASTESASDPRTTIVPLGSGASRPEQVTGDREQRRHGTCADAGIAFARREKNARRRSMDASTRFKPIPSNKRARRPAGGGTLCKEPSRFVDRSTCLESLWRSRRRPSLECPIPVGE